MSTRQHPPTLRASELWSWLFIEQAAGRLSLADAKAITVLFKRWQRTLREVA